MRGFRIQDNRFELPTQSSNWFNTSEDIEMGGVSCYAGFLDACKDLFLSTVLAFTSYSQAIKEAGGEAVLSVLDGDFVDEEPEGYVLSDCSEKRFTIAQIEVAWNAACGEQGRTFAELNEEYALFSYEEDALAVLLVSNTTNPGEHEPLRRGHGGIR